MREPKAHKTYPLLRELRRWQPRLRRGANSGRWAAWAESLQEHYGRIAIRHSALPLILAKQTALLARIDRWQHTALQFYPKINLAIGPILLRFGSSETPSPLVMHRLTTLMRAVSQSNRESIGGRRLRLSKPSVNGRNLDGRSGSDYSSNTSRLDVSGSLAQTALMTVFARAGAEDRGFGSASRYETALVQRSLLLVSRIANERRRIEESTRRDLVTRERQEFSKIVSRRIHDDAVAEATQGLRAATTGAMPSVTALPLDLESLTDQVVRSIDSRLVAHRERLGRVF